MAAISTIKDGFQDNFQNNILWAIGFFEGFEGVSVITEESQRLRVTLPIANGSLARNGYFSVSSYDLTGDRCFVKLVTPPDQVQDTQTWFALSPATGDGAAWFLANGTLQAKLISASSDLDSSSAAYVGSTHTWLSIRESAGDIFFETAPSTASDPPAPGDWVVFWTRSNPLTLTSVKVNLAAGTFSSQPSPGIAEFDGLNGATTQTNGDLAQPAPGVGTLALTGLAPSVSITGAQFLAPDGDVSKGGWEPSAGTTIFSVIGEFPSDETDYASMVLPTEQTFVVTLQDAVDPVSSTNHVVRYRIRGGGLSLVVSLLEGTSTIASWTHSPPPNAWTTFRQLLSAGEANSIVDYTNLRLSFKATP